MYFQAVPTVAGDPTSPWRHVDAINNIEKFTKPFANCDSIGEVEIIDN